MLISDCSYAEMLRRLRHRSQVGFVLARIPDRLGFNERPVADEVGEHDDLWLGHLPRHEWARHLPGYSHPGTWPQVAQWTPALVCKERMAGRGMDLAARCQ